MFGNLKFRHKIMLSVISVVVLFFAAFVAYTDSLQRDVTKHSRNGALEEFGRLIANDVRSWLGARILLVESLTQSLSRENGVESNKHIIEQRVFNSAFVYSYIGLDDGRYLGVTDGLPSDYDPRARPWYQVASKADGAIFTEPYLDETNNNLIITTAGAIRYLDRVIGVAGGDVSLQVIADVINSMDFGGVGYAFIVDAQGTVLITPEKNQVMKKLNEIYKGSDIDLESGIVEVEYNGEVHILGFTKVTDLYNLDWYVGINLNEDKANAFLDGQRTTIVIVAIAAVALMVVLLNLLLSALVRPLTNMRMAMQDIADGEGDLTKRLTSSSKDEFGVLAASFNSFVSRIHDSISQVSNASRKMHDIAQRVLDFSNSSIHKSDEQANRTNSVAAAINELGSAAQEIARNAADASQHASEASHQAEDGKRVVESTIQAMNFLSEKISSSCLNIETLNSRTVNIGQILEVIKGISQQTNLLALNAAIEAARAGDAGRGFAVVADEVRSLAHRTQESAQEIQKMIEELQVGASEAVVTMTESQRHSLESVEVANHAGARLGSVTRGIGEIDSMNQSVATATEEQTAVIDALNADITQINSLNQQGVENLKAILNSCEELDSQSVRLRQLVENFRI